MNKFIGKILLFNGYLVGSKLKEEGFYALFKIFEILVIPILLLFIIIDDGVSNKTLCGRNKVNKIKVA